MAQAKKDMITQILTAKGIRKNKKDAYDELVALHPHDPNAPQKAAGSVGGSTTHKFIDSVGNDYICMRDPVAEE